MSNAYMGRNFGRRAGMSHANAKSKAEPGIEAGTNDKRRKEDENNHCGDCVLCPGKTWAEVDPEKKSYGGT